MRTVAVFAAYAKSDPVWVWCRANPAGDGSDKITVTTPGGLQQLDWTEEDVGMGRAVFMFATQLTRSAIESDG